MADTFLLDREAQHIIVAGKRAQDARTEAGEAFGVGNRQMPEGNADVDMGKPAEGYALFVRAVKIIAVTRVGEVPGLGVDGARR